MIGSQAGKTDMDKGSKEEVLLSWRTHLARRQPRRAGGVIALVLAAAGLVLISSRNPLLAVGCVLALSAAAGEFLFPIHYRLTARGAYMRNFLSLRFLPWTQVRRCHRGPRGIKLSPLAYPSRLEAFRGLHLWVEGARQEQAVEIIRALRPAQAASTLNAERSTNNAAEDPA